MNGRFYGVGLGPGDPGLVTIKALEVIKAAEVVCVPRGDKSEGSLALSIVQSLLPGKECLTLSFPMSREASCLERHWQEAADSVARQLEQGKHVAFVTLGDPALYSTYIYLLRALERRLPELRAETIPGVTSFTAGAALAGVSLVEADQRLAIVPGSAPEESLRRILRDFDTVVILKIGKRLPQVQTLIAEMGLSGNAVLVSRAGLPDQAVIRDMCAVDDPNLGYLSLVMVKHAREASR